MRKIAFFCIIGLITAAASGCNELSEVAEKYGEETVGLPAQASITQSPSTSGAQSTAATPASTAVQASETEEIVSSTASTDVPPTEASTVGMAEGDANQTQEYLQEPGNPEGDVNVPEGDASASDRESALAEAEEGDAD